jgi:hypothetical protein
MSKLIWSNEDVEELKFLYPKFTVNETAEVLGRTVLSVRRKACNLGLHKKRDLSYTKSLEYRRKMRECKLGTKNPMYKHGWHAEKNLKMQCSICGIIENLDIHHCDGNHFNNIQSNLKVLCRQHHMEEDTRLFKLKERNKTEQQRKSSIADALRDSKTGRFISRQSGWKEE